MRRFHRHGFARIRRETCGHHHLLAFSCKTRHFCPSCHQKRVLLYVERVEERVLEKRACDAPTGTVVYLSRMHAGLERDFQLMPGPDWPSGVLIPITLHRVPDIA